MLTLFPASSNEPKNEPKVPEPHRIPRRLQLLPLVMLAIAALLQLAAWHRDNVRHAAPSFLPPKLAAGPTPHPHRLPVVATMPSPGEQARESQKAHEAKTRSLQLYANPDYAISLSYPRSYLLKESTELADELNPLLQQRTDGSPDQHLLARIELPDNLFPRTDFLAGYLSLSVNPTLTSDQCAQSIGVEEEAEPDTVVLNNIPFRSLQTSASADGTHTSYREYSAYSANVCYEIELAVVTLNDGSIAPVNQDRVFHHLDAILQSIRITHPQ